MKPLVGTLVALASPFKQGAFDAEAYRSHATHLLDQGVEGLVPIGTTGEANGGGTFAGSSELRFQRIDEGHQLIHFGDDAALFGEGWNGNKNLLPLSFVDDGSRRA